MSKIISGLSFLSYWDFYVYYLTGSLTTPEAGVLTTLKSASAYGLPCTELAGSFSAEVKVPSDEKGALGIHILLVLPAAIQNTERSSYVFCQYLD